MTSRLSPFNLGATKDFIAPSTMCCNPAPRPVRAIPTHREPSAASAMASTPSIPALDCKALGL